MMDNADSEDENGGSEENETVVLWRRAKQAEGWAVQA
jgi:hypothetical protein